MVEVVEVVGVMRLEVEEEEEEEEVGGLSLAVFAEGSDGVSISLFFPFLSITKN